MDQCEICGATVFELRRGRCWGCYSRWVDARPVGLGAACRMCGERRRTVLKSMELLAAWTTVCHNCAARIASLTPLPRSLDAIKAQLGRGRRDRRAMTVRITRPVEAVAEQTTGPIDEAMIIDITELAGDLESLAGDLTRIRFAPADQSGG
jgi:hypothetical protein